MDVLVPLHMCTIFTARMSSTVTLLISWLFQASRETKVRVDGLSIGYTPKARLLSDLFNRAPKARGE